jgi:hypothetical protein
LREISILFTVGLPSIAPQVDRRLGLAGVHIFGINPSHARTQRIRSSIAAVQSTTSKPPCIDPVGIQPLYSGEVYHSGSHAHRLSVSRSEGRGRDAQRVAGASRLLQAGGCPLRSVMRTQVPELVLSEIGSTGEVFVL